MRRIALIAILLAAPGAARADGSFGIRVGGAALDLRASADTPLIGGWLDSAADGYNEGIRAYNAAHGLSGAMAAGTIATDDLSWRSQLFLVTPNLRSGDRGYYARLDAPIGFGDGVWTLGAGIYPLNVGIPMGRAFRLHAGVGMVASYAWFSDASDSAGGLVQGRLALGGRVRASASGTVITFELGWTARALGGVVDRGGIDAMTAYDPRGAAPPPADELVRGGYQAGMLDLSVGIEWE